MENKLQKLLSVIALATRFLKNIIFLGNITKYLVGGKFKKPTNNPDLIDINTIDIRNLKTIDDVLDYVNQIGKERFTNVSIIKLKERIDGKPFKFKSLAEFIVEYNGRDTYLNEAIIDYLWERQNILHLDTETVYELNNYFNEDYRNHMKHCMLTSVIAERAINELHNQDKLSC